MRLCVLWPDSYMLGSSVYGDARDGATVIAGLTMYVCPVRSTCSASVLIMTPYTHEGRVRHSYTFLSG